MGNRHGRNVFGCHEWSFWRWGRWWDDDDDDKKKKGKNKTNDDDDDDDNDDDDSVTEEFTGRFEGFETKEKASLQAQVKQLQKDVEKMKLDM